MANDKRSQLFIRVHDETLSENSARKSSRDVVSCSSHRGVDLISDTLPFGRLWYGEQNAVSNAIGYAMHYSRSAGAVIRVYDENPNPKKATKTSDIFVLIVSIGPLRLPQV